MQRIGTSPEIAYFVAICKMYRCITTEILPLLLRSRERSEKQTIQKSITQIREKDTVMGTNKTPQKWLHIRLKEADYQKIYTKYSKSTDRSLSEYSRKVLLDKPISVNQRNQSLDDFMAEMIFLRQELNALGNNFNQVVKTLHQLREISDIKTWLLLHESNQTILLEKVNEISIKIYKISDEWLR